MLVTLRQLLPIITALIATAPAQAARSDWALAPQSQLRLLLEGTGTDAAGTLRGGVEIVLDPGWYTYWRTPGEAGVPPRFDFSGSGNIGDVEVFYPAPVRHDDGTSVSLIYPDEVVFPLTITPADPTRPVTLRVGATFGVCRDVCIPAQASAEVESRASADALTHQRLARYLQRVPQPAMPGRFDVEAVQARGDVLTIAVRMPDSVSGDLFFEPPEGWYVGQPTFVSRAAGVSRYRLSLAGKPPKAALGGQILRFVAVAGGEAIQKDVTVP